MAIRQIPLFVTEGMMKRLAGWAIKAFNNEVKAGRRSKLTVDELREPLDALGTAAAAAASSKTEEGKANEEDVGEKKTKKKKGKFGPGGSVKQAKILRADDRIDPLTGLKRSKGYGFLEMHTHADALRFIRWANANGDVHKLLHRWWIEDLKDKAVKLSSGAGSENAGETNSKSKGKGQKGETDLDVEARRKRLLDKIAELEKEAAEGEKSAARQGKTLMVEFAIENAMTVKRRQEKTEKSAEKAAKKRKRDAEAEAEAEEDGSEAQEEMQVDGIADERRGKERNSLGSLIGKKRRMRKAKKSG